MRVVSESDFRPLRPSKFDAKIRRLLSPRTCAKITFWQGVLGVDRSPHQMHSVGVCRGPQLSFATAKIQLYFDISKFLVFENEQKCKMFAYVRKKQ